MRKLSSEKRARHRNVRIKIIYSGPGEILFSLRCCQGPLNRRGIYRIIRLSELKGSFLVQSPNFTGEKTQAHLYRVLVLCEFCQRTGIWGAMGTQKQTSYLGGGRGGKRNWLPKGKLSLMEKAWYMKGTATERRSYSGQVGSAGRAGTAGVLWQVHSTQLLPGGQQFGTGKSKQVVQPEQATWDLVFHPQFRGWRLIPALERREVEKEQNRAPISERYLTRVLVRLQVYNQHQMRLDVQEGYFAEIPSTRAQGES